MEFTFNRYDIIKGCWFQVCHKIFFKPLYLGGTKGQPPINLSNWTFGTLFFILRWKFLYFFFLLKVIVNGNRNKIKKIINLLALLFFEIWISEGFQIFQNFQIIPDFDHIFKITWHDISGTNRARRLIFLSFCPNL